MSMIDTTTTTTPAAAPTFTDSPEQARVITAPADDDVLVVAGAGSGKTYTMTRRIIALIEQGVPPERILGLTFTRKAASELLARVSSAVSGRAGDGRSMFLKPEISTYDAFFQTIVRQYGLLVGFDQNTQPLSEAGAMQLASTAIERHMDLLLDEDFGDFGTVVSSVLALSHDIGNAMIGGTTATVDEAIARIRRWDAAFIAQLDAAIGDEPVPEQEPKPKSPGKVKDRAKYEAKLAEYRQELHRGSVYRCDRLRMVARRREILLTLVEEYEREKRRQNMAEFSDFTIAAYQLVTRFPSIGRRYRHRYTHVLLDEYQDTSTTQSMVIAALFHPGDAHAGDAGRSAVNAVGDPFQSIYSWRGASPGAFRMFQHDFGMPEGSRPYPLSVTRRNSRIVLEAANNLTAPLRIPPRRAGSSLMREVDVASLTAMDAAPEGTVGVLGFDTLGQEIDAVARFAKEAIRRYTPSDPAVRDNRPHVAVLFRGGKPRMAEFAQGLERTGLTTLIVGYSALLERPEVRDLLALLHVVADHTDSNSLMRLLATPRFGLTSAELTELAESAERLDTEYRYRALAEAGLIDGGDDREAQARIVHEYRDQVPHAVFLIDLLSRRDLPVLLRDGRAAGRLRAIGESRVSAIIRAGETIRAVQAVTNHPLTEIIETAVKALDLDIDAIVAQRITEPDHPLNPAMARSGVDAIISLVDTYTREIIEGTNPTLRGFMAWVDSLKTVEEETPTAPDVPVDVVLMTIHQSKGLEWDAVAIAGMTADAFPNRRSGLSITPDAEHPGGIATDGSWRPPEYHATMSTWLDSPSSVPVPVRVDAGILPRFPHDAASDADVLDALRSLDDVEVIDDEIYGGLRGLDIGEDMDAVDADEWYLTQGEEYGRRLLADERRLAYVALTRARYDALLTYSRHADAGRDPQDMGSRSSKPSVFWNEVLDSLCHRPDLVKANDADATGETQGDDPKRPDAAAQDVAQGPRTLDAIGVPRPDGYFVGEHAGAYREAVVESAWRAPVEPNAKAGALPWPSYLSPDVLDRLGADLDGGVGMEADAGTGSGVDAKPAETPAVSPDLPEPPLPERDSLLARAAVLVDDPDLMPWEAGDDRELDEHVRRKAEQLLAGGRQNVTALQARAGHMNRRDARMLWRGMVRPIPSVAPPSAEAGTIFHAWAQRFIDAFADGGIGRADPAVSTDQASGASEGSGSLGTAANGQSRESMIAELEHREAVIRRRADGEPDDPASDDPADVRSTGSPGRPTDRESELTTWQRRLVESRWALRRPAWAERQIVVALPQLDDAIVNGKLDAVFHGGLDADDPTKRFTIVDWKTGHRPKTRRDIDGKLVQLDWYRLLLARIENAPLDSIDATLYYLSEPDEGLRELHARAKTEQEILAELSSGIPEQSDND